jgi:hypothetical protein
MTVKQPHEARFLNGRAINWKTPPLATAKVKWTKKGHYGQTVTGSFRHICHLNRLNNLAIKLFDSELEVLQTAYNTTVAASAGTHDLDATVDVYISGVGWWEQSRFYRGNGLGGWYRHPPLFGNHYHGFTLPVREGENVSDDFDARGFKVGVYVDGGYSTRGGRVSSSQLEDFYNRAFGLSNQHTPGSDNSWFPADISRTVFDLKRYIARRVV